MRYKSELLIVWGYAKESWDTNHGLRGIQYHLIENLPAWKPLENTPFQSRVLYHIDLLLTSTF